jgi:hypothetical protein
VQAVVARLKERALTLAPFAQFSEQWQATSMGQGNLLAEGTIVKVRCLRMQLAECAFLPGLSLRALAPPCASTARQTSRREPF